MEFNEKEKFLDLAKTALVKNAQENLVDENSRNILTEKGKDIKLSADINSHNFICDFLANKTDFDILSEENPPEKSIETDYFWVVDPLDGTFNFNRGIPFCCSSIGLWHKDLGPILGAIYDLATNSVYAGIVGGQCFINDATVKVSSCEQIEKGAIATGFPIALSLTEENLSQYIKKVTAFKKVRMLGSAAMSLAMVASGKIDCYKEESIFLWDVAAGLALTLAAGGKIKYEKVSDPWLYNVIATNGNLDLI